MLVGAPTFSPSTSVKTCTGLTVLMILSDSVGDTLLCAREERYMDDLIPSWLKDIGVLAGAYEDESQETEQKAGTMQRTVAISNCRHQLLPSII